MSRTTGLRATTKTKAVRPQSAPTVSRPRINTSSIGPVKRERLGEQVYDVLFHRIVTGELRDGERLPSEHALCASFAVSRPVVRDALERLRKDGMVNSRRGSGTHVMHRPGQSGAPSVEKIDELLQNLEFRTIIEPEAAYLAALRRTGPDLEAIRLAVETFEHVAVNEGENRYHLDRAFHVAVAAAASNQRIYEAVRAIEHDIDHGVNLARHLARFDHLERRKAVCAEHRHIFELIRQQDAEAARVAMRSHLEQARIRMMNRRATVPKV